MRGYLWNVANVVAVVLLVLLSGRGDAADVTRISVNPPSPVLPVGATRRLTATGLFSDATSATLQNATLAAGGNHTCALAHGEVRCWGRNGSGQLGNGTNFDSSIPVTTAGIENALALAAGGDSSCALLSDGTARCWGLNDVGQLGNGTTATSLTPVTVTGITAVGLANGFRHACAVLANGGVRCWGGNTAGQLGNGTLAGSTTAIVVSGITSAIAIATGGNHSCAVLSTGGVKCWGDNTAGQLGNGTFVPSPAPVTVTGISDAVAITAGFDHSCALIAGGALQCWGRGLEGQLGNGGTTNSSTPVTVPGNIGRVVAISGGASHTCAVIEGGTMKCWGRDANGQLGNTAIVGNFPSPVSVVGVLTAVTIATGFEHSCALLLDGNTLCWGLNDAGQLGTGTSGGINQRSGIPLTVSGPVFAVNAGGNHTCVLTPNGTANCWGDGFYGQLGNGSTAGSALPVTVSGIDNYGGLALGFDHSCALLPNNSGQCWGRNDSGQLGGGSITPAQSTTPLSVSFTLGPAIAFAAGAYHNCAVLSDGRVQCWGQNNFGQLGTLLVGNVPFPIAVTGISTATAIAAGFEHTCALLSSGSVLCWGRGDEGELGNGGTANTNTPVAVTGITTATAIAAGNFHSCARLLGGQVRCWGRNVEGQLGNASTVGSAVPVSVNGLTNASGVAGGGFHNCARVSTGGVRCWGRGDLGQLGNGFFVNISSPVVVTGIGTAVAVDAGRSHSCAVLAGGILQCWGYNELGQLGIGTSGPGVNTATPATVNGVNMDAVALSWTSSNPAVATIDMSGHVRTGGLGTTLITAKYDSKTKIFSLTVAPDTDGDGVADPVDNCTDQSNPDQRDSNSDGYGNLCDADLNNSGLVTTADYAILRSVLNQSASASATAADADLNGSGTVTAADFAILRAGINKPPGPSGLHPAPNSGVNFQGRDAL